MDLHEALLSRRTIQRFLPGPVPADAIDRALAAAVHAPNHKTTWPWRFTLVGPAARERLFRVGLRLKAAKKGLTPELEEHVRTDMLFPDRLVVVSQVVDPDRGRAEEDYAACACAIQNLLLSLHADGVGAKWGTGGTLRDPETFDVLGLDPARQRIVGFVWVGRPAIVPQTPRRPALETVVRQVP